MEEMTPKQQDMFEVLLDIINNERKALVFMTLADFLQKPSDIRKVLNEGNIIEPFEDKNIFNYIERCLGDSDRNLIIEGKLPANHVPPRKNEPLVKAFKLTEQGVELQPLVAYGMTYLPSTHGFSANRVIGEMQTSGVNRSTYTKVQILRHLTYSGSLTLSEIQHITGIDQWKTEAKLEELCEVTDHNQNKHPFVMKNKDNSKKRAYRWLGKPIERSQFQRGTALDIVTYLSRSRKYAHPLKSLKKRFKVKENNIVNAMHRLRKLGYIDILFQDQLKRYHITDIGEDYVKNCIEIVAGAIAGKQNCIRKITINQPTDEMMYHAANVYAFQR